MDLLLQVLGLSFEAQNGGRWTSEAYDGTKYVVTRCDELEYELAWKADPSHQHFDSSHSWESYSEHLARALTKPAL